MGGGGGGEKVEPKNLFFRIHRSRLRACLLRSPEQAPHSPIYDLVPESCFPGVHTKRIDVLPAEDKPLLFLPYATTRAPGYIPESDPEEDPEEDDEEDPEEDPADYPADRGDNRDDEEPSDDDDDDDDDAEEEEHLAPADPAAVA
ncbi:hypothetical protein Tco_0018378 [Tanacetum coccineum]